MMKIDAINDKILQVLSGEGRISNLELADRVGLSPSACLRRVQELERSGAIRGYRAVIDPAARGAGFTVFLSVGLLEHTKHAQAEFERAVSRARQVRECHNVTGSVEYLLRVEVADLDAYKTFHTDVIGTLPMVRSLTSYVVMSSAKDVYA